MKNILFLVLIISLFPLQIYSQCTGSISSQIFFEDFGSGSNTYGPPLASWQSDMNYYNGVQPLDGTYTLIRSPHDILPVWFDSEDHTPNDTDGYMYLATPHDNQVGFTLFQDEVQLQCAYTNFEFSFWIMNVLPRGYTGESHDPNVRMEVLDPNGNLLAAYNSGLIPRTTDPTWKKVSLMFSSGNFTSVTIKLINLQRSRAGNDFAIDDISFSVCEDKGRVGVPAGVDPLLICPNSIVDFTADLNTSIYPSAHYLWQYSEDNEATWIDIPNSDSDTYSFDPQQHANTTHIRYIYGRDPSVLQNLTCRLESYSQEVGIAPDPNFSIQGVNQICRGTDLDLNLLCDQNLNNVTWTQPDGSQFPGQSVSIPSVQDSGKYKVEFVTQYGCTYQDSIQIDVLPTLDTIVNLSGCLGSSVDLGIGGNYTVTVDETIQRIYPSQLTGCDSTVNYLITALPEYNFPIDSVVCKNTQIIDPDGNSVPIVTDISYTYNYQTNEGCDSIVTVNYSTFPESIWQIQGNQTICASETLQLLLANSKAISSITWTLPDGSNSTANPLVITNNAESGLYKVSFVDENGCSYDDEVQIQVHPEEVETVNLSGCVGSPVDLGMGGDYTVILSETIQRVYPSQLTGCDSTVNYMITALPDYDIKIDSIVCYQAQVVDPFGNINILENDTTFRYDYVSSAGCDSTVVKNFIISLPEENQKVSACYGESIVLPDGNTIVADTAFTDIFYVQPPNLDCQKKINYSLTVNPLDEVSKEIFVCLGESYTLPDGNIITTDGIYKINSLNQYGCDSTTNYEIKFTVNACEPNTICDIEFPNAVSQNFDGVNDNFYPLYVRSCIYEDYNLRIYNRWGEKVFESNDPDESWIPTLEQRNFVYLWVTNYTHVLNDGSKERKNNSGIVTILK